MKKWGYPILGALTIFTMLAFLLPPALGAPTLIVTATLGVAWLWWVSGPAASTKQTARGVLAKGSVEDVGPVIDLLDINDQRLFDDTVALLIEILPKVRDEHRAEFTNRRLNCLRQFLRYSRIPLVRNEVDPSLTTAILIALSTVGDSTFLPIVSRMAKNDSDAKIRNAAEACATALQDKHKCRVTQNRLLRPSANEQLVSPAVAPGTKDATLLLRPLDRPGDHDQ